MKPIAAMRFTIFVRSVVEEFLSRRTPILAIPIHIVKYFALQSTHTLVSASEYWFCSCSVHSYS
jgi:hypothetical protein